MLPNLSTSDQIETEKPYQVLVIGGGINGVAIAREATAKGYRCLLVEKNDFAHATSSQSSKLIHGGIRYLEQGKIPLVREALRERNVMLQIAPHLVKPLRIHIPVYDKDKRNFWTIWSGCKLYDMLAGKDNLLPDSRIVSLKDDIMMGLKKEGLKGIIEYWDAQVFDSRLTLETALSAKEMGATVLNYTEVESIEPAKTQYLVNLKSHRDQKSVQIKANFVINAAGPWASQMDQKITRKKDRPQLIFVRGIHFVVHSQGQKTGFLTSPADGRVVFVLPWLDDYEIIGTTETLYQGKDFDEIPASDGEKEYLFKVFEEYFPESSLAEEDILHIFSGVRTLIMEKNKSLNKVSREYLIKKELISRNAGYFAVFGGKLTTHRSLAAKIIHKLKWHLTPSRYMDIDTAKQPLVGASKTDPDFGRMLLSRLKQVGIPANIPKRWQDIYGNKWQKIALLALDDPKQRKPVARDFFLRAELTYQVYYEMAFRLEDVIFRRTCLGFELTQKEQNEIQDALIEILGESS